MVTQTNHQTTKYTVENKWHSDLFTNGENLIARTPPGDFQVTTPETPLLSQQAGYKQRNPKCLTDLQLNPYPNTQLDLVCSDSSPFRCTTLKYVINQLCGSQYTTSIIN